MRINRPPSIELSIEKVFPHAIFLYKNEPHMMLRHQNGFSAIMKDPFLINSGDSKDIYCVCLTSRCIEKIQWGTKVIPYNSELTLQPYSESE